MSVELEPLLQRLSALAPRFGRLTGDIEAMVSRGRAGDFKGVMQNARLVVEALCRSIVIDDLKQTPGKAMLDDLVQKLRQQQHQGVMPLSILAHVGTVQAWGNLSSHDHAGSLDDAGVTVGEQEVAASLNSVVAILAWYAEKKGLDGAKAPDAAQGTEPGGGEVAKPPPGTSRPVTHGKAFALLALFVAMGVAGSMLVLKVKGEKDTTNPFAGVDVIYNDWKEPPPPLACRRVPDVPALMRSPRELDALMLMDSPSAEAAYFQARAAAEQREPRWKGLEVSLRVAQKCPGFANPHFLAGKLALEKGDFAAAETHVQAAVAAAPKWLDPRFLLAGLLAKRGEAQKDDGVLAQASAQLDEIIKADPSYGAAYFMRGSIGMSRAGDDAAKKLAAIEDYCKAGELRVVQGKKACEALRSAAP